MLGSATTESSTNGRFRTALLVPTVVVLMLLAAGCGNWEDQRMSSILGSRVTVTVTAGGGEELMVRHNLRLAEGMTALDALSAVAEVRASGATVQLVNGRGGGVIDDLGPVPAGWFYRVNGFEGDLPANMYKLRPGDSLWWDLRRWDAYPVLPVAVGGFPEMVFLGFRDVVRPPRITYEEGFEDRAREFARLLEQLSPEVRELEYQGLVGGAEEDKGELVASAAVEPARSNIVIGTWDELLLDPFLSEIAFNPRAHGLTVWMEGGRIRRQHPDAEYSEPLVEAEGFVWAATTDGAPDGSLVLVISGRNEQGVEAAAVALREGRMHGFLAAAVDRDGNVIP